MKYFIFSRTFLGYLCAAPKVGAATAMMALISVSNAAQSWEDDMEDRAERVEQRVDRLETVVYKKSKTSSAATTASLRTHRVANGETLYRIAQRYGVLVSDLMHLNRLSSPDSLRIGQVLQVPSAGGKTAPTSGTPVAKQPQPPQQHLPQGAEGSYVIKKGDTFYSLSKKFGVSIDVLTKANKMKSTTALMPGRTLIIPGNYVKNPSFYVNKPAQTPSKPEADSANKTSKPEVPINHLDEPTPPARPSKTYHYTAQDGDTVEALADVLKTTPEKIRELNPKLGTHQPRAGETLTLPDTGIWDSAER